jgi:hypothetical protein
LPDIDCRLTTVNSLISSERRRDSRIARWPVVLMSGRRRMRLRRRAHRPHSRRVAGRAPTAIAMHLLLPPRTSTRRKQHNVQAGDCCRQRGRNGGHTRQRQRQDCGRAVRNKAVRPSEDQMESRTEGLFHLPQRDYKSPDGEIWSVSSNTSTPHSPLVCNR